MHRNYVIPMTLMQGLQVKDHLTSKHHSEDSKKEMMFSSTYNHNPKGENSKFYTPWRGIYKVIERTSQLTYVLHKKGGRTRRAHVNRLKFFDPLNSLEDPKVHISVDDDEKDQMDDDIPPTGQVQDQTAQDPIEHHPSTTQINTRVTRSKTRSLPSPIDRYSASATGIRK